MSADEAQRDGLGQRGDVAEAAGIAEEQAAGEPQVDDATVSAEEAEDPAEILGEMLEAVVDGLGLDAEVVVERRDDVLLGRLDGDDLGLFIGRRGQTIDAVQHLAQRIAFRGGPQEVRVVIDADGYRERRAQTLRTVALDAAEDALSSGEPVELDPMPASERRIVHECLRDRTDVSTHSEGEEPERYLVVEPAGDADERD